MEAASRHALMTSIIALSSIRTTDTSILAKQAISGAPPSVPLRRDAPCSMLMFRGMAGVRKLLNVQYCAVYVENARTSKLPQSEYSETCQRWDSLDIATTVKRSAGIPGKVFKQRSPVMMDHVSDLDAGVLPQQQMGKRRSLLAVPVIGAAEGKVRAVLLAAWKKDETAFNDQDETNLSDLAAVLAESLKSELPDPDFFQDTPLDLHDDDVFCVSCPDGSVLLASQTPKTTPRRSAPSRSCGRHPLTLPRRTTR